MSAPGSDKPQATNGAAPKPTTGDGTPMKPAPLDPLSPQVRKVVEQAMIDGAQLCLLATGQKNAQEFKEYAQGVAALGQALSAKIGFGG